MNEFDLSDDHKSRLEDIQQARRDAGRHDVHAPMANGRKHMSLTQAIDMLTGENAEREIAQRIESLSSELEKLKKLQKALFGGKSTTRKAAEVTIDGDLETSIVELVSKNNELWTCAGIAERFGMTAIGIGKLVKASSRLAKDGAVVVVTE